jgi:hypothetical protein
MNKKTLSLVVLALALCLLVSLTVNAAVGGWAFVSHRELEQSRSRVGTLEAGLGEAKKDLQDAQGRIATLESVTEQPCPFPEPDPTEIAVLPTLDPADKELMDTVEEQVVTMRGLSTLQSVERKLMTLEQLRAYVLDDFAANYSPKEARDDALSLSAFDALDPSIDLYSLLADLYIEQIAGFYDPQADQIVVIVGSGAMGQMERLTYAHEYTHALQDQHFDLEALGFSDDAEEKFDADALAARLALVEGDATLLMQEFLYAHFSSEEMLVLLEEMGEVDTPVFDSAPEAISDELMFPYTGGLNFVQALYDQGGWAAVDAAYANPPLSTEHVLHPERYLAGDNPQSVVMPPLTDTLGADWRQVDADVLGEHFLGFYLAQEIPNRDARKAVEGWGGDRYVVHYRDSDGALLMAARVVWDGPADAEEFVDGYVAYADSRFGRTLDGSKPPGDGAAFLKAPCLSVSRVKGPVRRSMTESTPMCWEGEDDALCLAWGVVDTVIVLGPDKETAMMVLDVVGLVAPES